MLIELLFDVALELIGLLILDFSPKTKFEKEHKSIKGRSLVLSIKKGLQIRIYNLS